MKVNTRDKCDRFMAYQVNLSSNQQLIIANRGQQTTIALSSTSPGQQQSQSNSFTTGTWTDTPLLYQLESGFVLQINSDLNKQFILIQGNNVSAIAKPQLDKLDNAAKVNLQEISSEQTDLPTAKLKPMQPMQPMQPMKMGNMSMDINTMSMQMGNMSLGMEKEQKTTSTTNFCTQCGTKVKTSDLFCGNCGNKLDN